MRNLDINIAIDGHSSCGKSTIAKAISNRFRMVYIDTGAMYRAITLYCIDNNIINNFFVDHDLLLSHLSDIDIRFLYSCGEDQSETFLNGKNVESSIRSLEVSNNVSVIAEIPVVREKLVAIQRNIGLSKNVVMDGRDIGTNVFPDAELKFFITADLDVRAQRRFEEMKNIDCKVTYQEVLQNINKRDTNDMDRRKSPLLKASDAILIDTSLTCLDEQNENVFEVINNYLLNES